MKVFAMLMVRFALVMLLSSLLQNGTKATFDELNELEKLKKSYQQLAVSIAQQEPIICHHPANIKKIKMPLIYLLNVVNIFPLKEEMKELLDRRLQKPLETAIRNCNKLLNEIEQSGLEDNKNYLGSLSSKIHSIAKGIEKEFVTFISEVELELIEKVKWTSEINQKLGNKFYDIWTSSLVQESYCETNSFTRVVVWTRENKSPRSETEVKELQTLILEAKLKILEKELSEKIAGFAQQQQPQDVDGFMVFADEFKNEWKQIEHKMITANIADKKIDDTEKTYRERLDELANRAMEETAPLKGIITKKLDQLCPGSEKNLFKRLDQLLFKKDKKEQKKRRS